jgi:DNA-binding response OmpR family regulator
MDTETRERRKVLVAEDDPFTQELLVMELSDAGYEVAAAPDGKKALEMVRDWAPDLILLDIMMPELDGLSVLREIRSTERGASLPVILISARNAMDDKLTGLAEGANDYLTKPFDMREVLARVALQFRMKELEAKALEVERLRAVLEMAGAAAHELSQPITGALGHIYLMLNTEDAPDGRKLVSVEDLRAAESCLRRARETLLKMQSIRRYSVTEYREGIRIVDINRASDAE